MKNNFTNDGPRYNRLLKVKLQKCECWFENELLYRYIPNFGAAGFTGRAFDPKRNNIMIRLFVYVRRVLFGGSGAVTEVPFPGSDLAY